MGRRTTSEGKRVHQEVEIYNYTWLVTEIVE